LASRREIDELFGNANAGPSEEGSVNFRKLRHADLSSTSPSEQDYLKICASQDLLRHPQIVRRSMARNISAGATCAAQKSASYSSGRASLRRSRSAIALAQLH
jgi:hypothetical protein